MPFLNGTSYRIDRASNLHVLSNAHVTGARTLPSAICRVSSVLECRKKSSCSPTPSTQKGTSKTKPLLQPAKKHGRPNLQNFATFNTAQKKLYLGLAVDFESCSAHRRSTAIEGAAISRPDLFCLCQSTFWHSKSQAQALEIPLVT